MGNRALAGMVVLLASIACKQGKKKNETAPAATPSHAAAPAPASAAAVASAPPTPKDKPLSELFAGPPDLSVVMTKRVTDKYSGYLYISVPKGWKANVEQYEGMVILDSDDGTAHMFCHSEGGSSMKNVKFWVRGGLRQKAKITWDDNDTAAKLGPHDIDVHVGTGKGTYAGKPSSCYYVRADLRTVSLMQEGCIAEGAPPERKKEMVAAMQTAWKQRKL